MSWNSGMPVKEAKYSLCEKTRDLYSNLDPSKEKEKKNQNTIILQVNLFTAALTYSASRYNYTDRAPRNISPFFFNCRWAKLSHAYRYIIITGNIIIFPSGIWHIIN